MRCTSWLAAIGQVAEWFCWIDGEAATLVIVILAGGKKAQKDTP